MLALSGREFLGRRQTGGPLIRTKAVPRIGIRMGRGARWATVCGSGRIKDVNGIAPTDRTVRIRCGARLLPTIMHSRCLLNESLFMHND